LFLCASDGIWRREGGGEARGEERESETKQEKRRGSRKFRDFVLADVKIPIRFD
jgi:hypothetical protein